MIKVKNGQVETVGLLTSGTLSDGTTVSNYNLLPSSVLAKEGWLPSEDNKPAYDENTQTLAVEGYTVLADKVTVNYIVVDKPQDIYDYILEQMGV